MSFALATRFVATHQTWFKERNQVEWDALRAADHQQLMRERGVQIES
jgi:hypothetical protein